MVKPICVILQPVQFCYISIIRHLTVFLGHSPGAWQLAEFSWCAATQQCLYVYQGNRTWRVPLANRDQLLLAGWFERGILWPQFW